MKRSNPYIRERLLLTTSDDSIQFLALILLPIQFIWLLYGSVETSKLIIWGVWNSSLVFAGLFGYKFNVKLIKTYPEKYLLPVASFFIATSSTCWIYAVFLISDALTIIQVTGAIIVITMFAAISTLILSIFPLFYSLVSIPVMLTLSWRVYTLDILHHETLALFPLASLVILLSISRSTYITQLNGIKLRKQLEAALDESEVNREDAVQANSEKTQFLAAVNHDMRQPVQAINYFVSSLDEIEDRKKHKILIAHTLESINGLSDLLVALSDISRLDANQITIIPEHFYLDEILEKQRHSYQNKFADKNLSLRLPKIKTVVNTDPIQLERIIQNLLSNALNYTHKGSVTISTKQHDSKTLLSISDTGIGIDASEHENVFNEFYQVGNKERDRRRGLGLGLAIVRRLCDAMDLELTLESALNSGSTITIALPTSNSNLVITRESESTDHWDIANLNVLIIDDEIDVRESLTTLLDTWDCNTRAYSTSSEIINESSTAHWQPDILLCDYRLINETGAEAIIKIRKYFNSKIPAIIITGDTSSLKLNEIADTGHPLLQKPVSPAVLRANIQKLLSKDNLD
ncbi:MAG: response regulator [Gammaproteobacteria bacterium]|nr:response regulator [Gammaproteobacteria bacterium]